MSSGFVAGTLVHTDKGLVAIQNLKVGDLVFVKIENETLLKKVVKNIQNQLEQIFQLIIRKTESLEDDTLIFTDEVIYLTSEQNIHIKMNYETNEENKWKSVYNLCDFEVINNIHNSNSYGVQSLKEVIEVRENIGLCLKVDDYDLDYDTYIKFENTQSFTYAYDFEYGESEYVNIIKIENLKNLDLENKIESDVFKTCSNYLVNRDFDKFMLLKIYSLEIEEANNFFVGKSGILVGDLTIQGNNE